MSHTIVFLNSLHPKLNFREVRVINEISRYSANINGLTIDVFEKKNGFGMEFRSRNVQEKKTLSERLKTLNLASRRKDFVFYPWPRKLSLDQDVLKNRLEVLVELATINDPNELNSDAKLLIKSL